MSIDFAAVLNRMVEVRASDVHLSPGFAPAIRVRGKITPMDDYPALTPQDTRPWADALRKLLTDREAWEEEALRSREAALRFVAGLDARALERYLFRLQPAESAPAARRHTVLDRLSPEKRALLLKRLKKTH